MTVLTGACDTTLDHKPMLARCEQQIRARVAVPASFRVIATSPPVEIVQFASSKRESQWIFFQVAGTDGAIHRVNVPCTLGEPLIDVNDPLTVLKNAGSATAGTGTNAAGADAR
ncbi:hypothetical protein [uncultured Sphingomonas sp.]|uniref:hypothetical protein n=1 Tax=uncultured Sphingomonas sp. TaxID=158754 RepID=UPI0035CC2953